MLIDTHTHPYLPEFGPDQVAIIDNAVAAGIGFMIMPNVDIATIEPMKSLHQARPDVTAMGIGLHPTELGDDPETALDAIEAEARANRTSYVAVGETGIDLYWDKTNLRAQTEAFDRQLDLAVSLDLPVIIHCREALDETLGVLANYRHTPLRGVMHSFGGTPDDVERISSVADLYFGINGIVTFKNSKLSATLPHIAPDRLLLETDAPYLAPVPLRGRRNESAFMIHTAAHVAHILGKTTAEIEWETTENARTLFAI